MKRYTIEEARELAAKQERTVSKEEKEKLEQEFIGACRFGKLKIDKREFCFHPVRRWRFDFAWPAAKVAVEIEGGIYVQGRHNRGAAFAEDCRKYNAAVLLGWRILRYTAGDLTKRPVQVVEEVKSLIELHAPPRNA